MSKSSKIVATKYNTIDKNIIGASKNEKKIMLLSNCLFIQYYDIISLLLFLIAFFEVKELRYT